MDKFLALKVQTESVVDITPKQLRTMAKKLEENGFVEFSFGNNKLKLTMLEGPSLESIEKQEATENVEVKTEVKLEADQNIGDHMVADEIDPEVKIRIEAKSEPETMDTVVSTENETLPEHVALKNRLNLSVASQETRYTVTYPENLTKDYTDPEVIKNYQTDPENARLCRTHGTVHVRCPNGFVFKGTQCIFDKMPYLGMIPQNLVPYVCPINQEQFVLTGADRNLSGKFWPVRPEIESSVVDYDSSLDNLSFEEVTREINSTNPKFDLKDSLELVQMPRNLPSYEPSYSPNQNQLSLHAVETPTPKTPTADVNGWIRFGSETPNTPNPFPYENQNFSPVVQSTPAGDSGNAGGPIRSGYKKPGLKLKKYK